MAVERTVEEINEKIKSGNAVVLTAEEMVDLVESKGAEVAAKKVDIVTTGTFGAMCSSGAFLNFGHSDPPIKMEKVLLNGVDAYHGNAAVDCYLGVTKADPERLFEYGGGHVIEDLVSGKSIHLESTAYGTDCYPRRSIETDITIHDLNQATLCNPRNAYQRYAVATNGRSDVIYTYMGKLLPDYGNATYSGAGCLSPLSNDPDYETIGTGTRIFLGGGTGYVIGEGTQHDPKNSFGTLMVNGNLKQMSPKYLKGASFTKYGTSMYVGIGIPIPILNVGLAKKTGISDEEISANLMDYGVPRRVRPILKKTDYGELRSGKISLKDKDIPVTALSSLKIAREIADELKKWIEEGGFYLTKPVETLPIDGEFKPMKVTREYTTAGSVMIEAVTCSPDEAIKDIANRIIDKNVNHIVVVENKRLSGIVTSFDITKAIAKGENELSSVMTKKVVVASPDEPVESCVQNLSKYDISALPVVDQKNTVLGIVTSEILTRLVKA